MILRRILPSDNCVNHRIISKDIIVYDRRAYVRWSGRGFGDCNDILFISEDLRYSLLFAPSRRLPVIVSILYSKPNIVRELRALIVGNVKEFIKCLFNYAEIIVKDLVALDYMTETKEIIEANKDATSGLKYVADISLLYKELLDTCKKLCKTNENKEHVEIFLGPEIDTIKQLNKINYSIQEDFTYIHDGSNSVFIDIREIDPFEVGEEYILIIYGVYNGRELAHASYLGEETPEEQHFRELVSNALEDILREDSKLKSPKIIAERLTNIISKENHI